MKTANLAIVFTDIQGYTARTSRQTHEENHRMLRVHDALLTPVFKAFDGRPIKTIGDAFLVVFDSPTRAVLCGVAIQDRLWDYNRRVATDDQIHVRVAVNMGEVRLEKGDVFGEPVNIAARVEALAEAGEVLFTDSVYLAMNKAEVPAELHGVHELKGIPEPVRVHRVPGGAYRIASQASGLPPEGPPYGGLALSRVPELLEPDPQILEGSSELVSQLSAAAASGARDVTRQLTRLAGGSMGFVHRLPAWTRGVVGAGVLTLIAAAFIFAPPFDPVERALSRGDLAGARAALERLAPGPKRSYLAGRLKETEGGYDPATRQYEAAYRAGEPRGFDRLERLTKHEACAARAAAARALGRIGERSALRALRRLEAKEDLGDEAGDGVVAAIFGCKSRQAARDAIRAIEARKR